MKMTLPVIAVSSALCAVLLSGCTRSSPQEQPGVATAAALLAEPVQAAPIATPTPKPTPKPDPLLNYRRAQQIPQWAKNRVLHKVPVRPGQKVFALTFDDGPWPVYTRQILDILARSQVKATFFMVGQEVRAYPEIARSVRDAGHAIGSHSWNHPSRPRDAAAQIRNTSNEFQKVLGFRPTLFRPPYGLLKNGMASRAMKDGNAVLIWSADCHDWKQRSAQQISRTILNQASPGGIALMHDGGGHRAATVAALPIIIRGLKARGYRFVTVPELLELRYVPEPKVKAVPARKATSGKSTRGKNTHGKTTSFYQPSLSHTVTYEP